MSWQRIDGHAEPLRGCSVLVVEDEPLIALELESLLTDEGADVVGSRCTPAQSLRLARRAPLSAALLDVRLGHHTVASVAEALTSRGVPFAFYTGQTEADEVRARWPRAPVIAKPSPARQLVAVINSLCHPARDGGGAHLDAHLDERDG